MEIINIVNMEYDLILEALEKEIITFEISLESQKKLYMENSKQTR